MEDDLKILKVEYLSNHSLDPPQVAAPALDNVQSKLKSPESAVHSVGAQAAPRPVTAPVRPEPSPTHDVYHYSKREAGNIQSKPIKKTPEPAVYGFSGKKTPEVYGFSGKKTPNEPY